MICLSHLALSLAQSSHVSAPWALFPCPAFLTPSEKFITGSCTLNNVISSSTSDDPRAVERSSGRAVRRLIKHRWLSRLEHRYIYKYKLDLLMKNPTKMSSFNDTTDRGSSNCFLGQTTKGNLHKPKRNQNLTVCFNPKVSKSVDTKVKMVDCLD